MNRRTARLTAGLGVTLVLGLLVAEPAEARRGGSFGSRGARTYSAPPPTRTAPEQTAPVQRSMTPPPAKGAQTPAAAPAAAGAAAPAAPRGGFLGGIGGGLLGGLVAGGLIGMLLGNGFGGLSAGLMNTLLQVAAIGLAVFLLMALFRRRRAPAPAPASGAAFAREGAAYAPSSIGGAASAGSAYRAPPTGPSVEIGVIQADREAFEQLLTDVQDAFAREDYGRLRELTTPEVMSYLSEELSQNATQGLRNDVSGTRLLEADVAEAWREGDAEYATAAMRYESQDVMRDRQSGAVVSGDPDQPTETTELWTFVRRNGEPWKLAAIQEA